MSGPNTQPSQQISQEQSQIARDQNALQKQNYDRMLKLEQPAIDLYTKETTNATTALQAVAPEFANIDRMSKASEDSIFNQVAPGAARDSALAQLQIGKNDKKAGLLNQTTMSAFDKLANIGSGFGAFSLQELGASLSAFGGAANTQQTVMNADAQSKAATMGFLGDIVGAAGGAAGGYFSHH